MKVLNISLYTALLNVFGDVRVSNQGAPLRARVVQDLAYQNRKRVEVAPGGAGEYYRVSCPFCGDARFRLWVNHRWGTHLSGVSLDHLVVCYNEHCEQHEEGFRTKLKNIVAGYTAPPERAIKAAEADTDFDPNQRPAVEGNFIRIDKLPEQHAAVRYMRDVRRFDIGELGSQWGVSWCDFSLVLPPDNRLFFPLYDVDDTGEVVLMGGQARWMDLRDLTAKSPKDAAKYFTVPGTRKSQTLYNGYRARNHPELVVVCEGPLDAIRVGPEYGVALFGKAASHTQRQLLYEHWGSKGGTAVLALDPDATAETNDLAEWLRSWKRYCVLPLPKGKDVGDMPSDTLWEMLTALLRGGGQNA